MNIRRAVLVVACLAFVSSPSARAGADPAESLTLEKIFGTPSLLAPVPTQIKWRGDGGAVSFIRKLPEDADGRKASALVVREVPSGRERVICIADTVAVPADLRKGNDAPFSISSYDWNSAGTRAAFSFRGELFLLDAGTARISRLTQDDGAERNVTFAPDGTMLAYTRGNDLFTLDVATSAEVRHTSSGCDTVYNGILNWIYMEELFTRGEVRAYWWSPDGSKLAFLEIRDGGVPVYPIVDQVPTDATYELQHYPKPGDPNPVVRVGIVNARGGAVTWTDVDTKDDSYIARVNWVGDGSSVAIEKLNRAQNRHTMYFADAATGRSEVVLEESSDSWVNVTYAKHFYKKKRQFLWGSERTGYMHLHLHYIDGSPIRRVTKGDWTVFDLAGVDEKKSHVYFIANEGSVPERHLYRVNEDGKDLRRITREEGTHRVTLSPNFKYFIDEYSNCGRPTRYSVHEIGGKHLFDVGDLMSDELAAMQLPAPEFFTIEREGRTYYCRITKPADMDPSKKYPVLVYVYGGPGSQVVRKSWSRHDLWHAYMNQNGYVVFSLDNRGSEGRGKAWEEPLLRRMGAVELEDQRIGVEYLKTLPWVDPERIGIWGWSYGGYMALLALFNAGDVFRAGVSVAPVTDWRLYDSIYTERYMKLPAENTKGYDASAPLTHAEKLQGSLLLMHGDADDNVHVQHSIALVKELIAAGKDFDFMLYPQKEHGISGNAERIHLYRKMTTFFDRHLKASEPSVP